MLVGSGCGALDVYKRQEWDGPVPRIYADHREMLAAEPGLDIAAVATESGEHARIALDCIDAGVNAIVEKPVAMSMADACLLYTSRCV